MNCINLVVPMNIATTRLIRCGIDECLKIRHFAGSAVVVFCFFCHNIIPFPKNYDWFLTGVMPHGGSTPVLLEKIHCESIRAKVCPEKITGIIRLPRSV